MMRTISYLLQAAVTLAALLPLAPGVRLTRLLLVAPAAEAAQAHAAFLASGLALALVAATFASIYLRLSGRRHAWRATTLHFALAVGILVAKLQGAPFPRGAAPDPSSVARVREALVAARERLEGPAREGQLDPEAVERRLAAIAAREGPYLRHGRRLRLRLVVEEGEGPRLDAGAETLPGTIFVRISREGDRAWLTGVVLDRGPVGRLAFLEASRGRPLVEAVPSNSK